MIRFSEFTIEISIKNKFFDAWREDHFALFKRWWYFEKLQSSASLIARSYAQIVLLPVHIRAPRISVRAFFQEGLEKSIEKGCKTDIIINDRESINAYFVFLWMHKYVGNGFFY